MADELIQRSGGELVEALDGGGLGEMLKPLIREIHLFDSYVAGTTHLADQSVLTEIKEDDRLRLQREENKFDDNAILLFTESGKKLGAAGKASLKHRKLTIAADVLGETVRAYSSHPGSSLGVAFLAGMAAGVFTDWSEIHSFLQDPKVYEPDPNAHAIYDKSYQIYRDLYPETKASSEALAKLYE